MQFLGAISKTTEWPLFVSKANFITVIQVYAPTSNAEEADVEQFYEDHYGELPPGALTLCALWALLSETGQVET